MAHRARHGTRIVVAMCAACVRHCRSVTPRAQILPLRRVCLRVAHPLTHRHRGAHTINMSRRPRTLNNPSLRTLVRQRLHRRGRVGSRPLSLMYWTSRGSAQQHLGARNGTRVALAICAACVHQSRRVTRCALHSESTRPDAATSEQKELAVEINARASSRELGRDTGRVLRHATGRLR